MVGFLAANMIYLPNFRSLGPCHGLEQAPVAHRPGPDQLLQLFILSSPKLDQGRPPREGFRSISLKMWEEIAVKNYGLSFLCIGMSEQEIEVPFILAKKYRV